MVSRKVETFHDLVVWQKSHELTMELFNVKLNKKETESLANQIRTAAAAIPSNIAIGFKKRGKKPKLHYYRSALNAVQELEYLLLLANDLKLLKNHETLAEELDNVEHMLKRLIRSNSPQQS